MASKSPRKAPPKSTAKSKPVKAKAKTAASKDKDIEEVEASSAVSARGKTVAAKAVSSPVAPLATPVAATETVANAAPVKPAEKPRPDTPEEYVAKAIAALAKKTAEEEQARIAAGLPPKPAPTPRPATPPPPAAAAAQQQAPVQRQAAKSSHYDIDDEDLQPNFNGSGVPSAPIKEESTEFSIKLSGPLARKMRQTARDEGISIDEFARELLAEGVVLRAWEIVERKGAMRGGSQQPQQQGGGHRQGGYNRGNGGGGNHQGGGNNNRRPGNFQGQGQGGGQRNGWMEDRASFLEYVRNQEGRQR